MTDQTLLAFVPYMVVGAASILVMLTIGIKRSYLLSWLITVAGLAAGFVLLFLIPWPGANGTLFAFTAPVKYFNGLIIASDFVIVLYSYRYMKAYPENREEFYLLLLLATLGAMLLAAAIHFISFLVGLEILSVSLYPLLGYVRNTELPTESATKYFILTAVASAVVVFGLGLVYYQSGTMRIDRIGSHLMTNGTADPLTAVGVLFVLGGLAFKLAVFPFHMWAADVYQGSPLPSTAVIATVSKISVFVFLYRFVAPTLVSSYAGVRIALIVLAIGSMLVGNWLALRQQDLKRIIAYSSTANLGYLLIPLVSSGTHAAQAALFYLTMYSATTLGMLGVMTVLSSPAHELSALSEYRGLTWNRPLLSIVLILMLLSLAGVPVTVGFFGKLYLFQVGVAGARWVLSAIFVAASALGLYYYLRVVVVQLDREAAAGASAPVQPLAGAALAIVTAVVVFFGVYPTPLIALLGLSGIG